MSNKKSKAELLDEKLKRSGLNESQRRAQVNNAKQKETKSK